jgi:hypothetical protein
LSYNYSNDLGIRYSHRVNDCKGKYFWPLTPNKIPVLPMSLQKLFKCIWSRNKTFNGLLVVSNFTNYLIELPKMYYENLHLK